MLRSCVIQVLGVLTLVAADCTRTQTVYTTVTATTTATISSTYPVVTKTHYSSTVLIGTPYTGPHPFPSVTDTFTCGYKTPAAATATSASIDPYAKCTTVQTTVTVKYKCTQTLMIEPAPVQVSKKGVLTTMIPDFCASPPKDGTGAIPSGDIVQSIQYPYFAHTVVECCISCSQEFFNDVASGFIVSGLDCQCLVNVNGTYDGQSDFCPGGIETYDFLQKKGHLLPGPCRKASS